VSWCGDRFGRNSVLFGQGEDMQQHACFRYSLLFFAPFFAFFLAVRAFFLVHVMHLTRLMGLLRPVRV
jgi:hypothetical protein